MLVNHVKRIVHCFLEYNEGNGITAPEVLGISVNRGSVFKRKDLLENGKYRGLVGYLVLFYLLSSGNL
jgi:hypothetical protein